MSLKKFRIHIKGNRKFMDKNVSVEIELPSIPDVREKVHLLSQTVDELNKQAAKTKEIANNYLPEWGSSLEDLDFSKACCVYATRSSPGYGVQDIELTVE